MLGQIAVSVAPAVASGSDAPFSTPSFELPDDLLTSADGDVTVTALTYATDPFEGQNRGAPLQNGSLVTSLTLGSGDTTNLTTPIVLRWVGGG